MSAAEVPQPILLPGGPGSVEQLTRIEAMFADAERTLNARLEDILARGPEWFREEARLRRLLAAAHEEMAAINAALDEPSLAQGLGELYGQGATSQEGVLQQAFNWNQPHLGAVDRIASDTFSDLLSATRYVEDSAKTVIRQAAKLNTARKLTTGKTALQAGADLAKQLRASGIGIVTYRNGARHGVGEYSRMVMRTKSAVAYNVGTLNHSVAAGVHLFEIIDGSDCGLSYHDDPTLANGLIVDSLTASTFVIAHPNCRRVFGARPDLTREAANTFNPSTSAAQRSDQQAFEKFMRDQKRAQGRKRVPRGKQPPKPKRVPRTPRNAPPPEPVVPEPVPTPEPRPAPEPRKAPAPRPAPPRAEPRPRPAPKPKPKPEPKPEPKPKISATKGPAPGTSRLADTFEYEDAEARAFKSITDGIDKLHGMTRVDDAKLNDRLVVQWKRQTGTKGGGFTTRGRLSGGKPRRVRGQPYEVYRDRLNAWRSETAYPRIQVMSNSKRVPNSPQAQFAFAHEVGHRVDAIDTTHVDMVMATGRAMAKGRLGPDVNRAVEEFIDAVRGSEAFGRVAAYARRLNDPDAFRYVTSAEEVWARAYSQWVARELGTPELREGLRWWRDSSGWDGYQWTDEEFDRVIGPAVEEVLRARGMMR